MSDEPEKTTETFEYKGVEVNITEATAGIEVTTIQAQKGFNIDEEVKKAIDGLPRVVEMYSKPGCGFCVKAKLLCLQEGIELEEISAVENREALIERVTADSGRAPQQLPQIYLDGKYVGGYTELAKLLADEKNA